MARDYSFRYRLFASVDLTGSTAYKQRGAEDRWVPVFENFLADFPRFVEAAYSDIPGGTRGIPNQSLRVWKYAGDEILFVADLGRHEETAIHLYALKKAIDGYTGTALQKLRPLGLKAAAWSAGFPVNNAEVRLTTGRGGDQTTIVDYLGPAIDLGFRLSAHADERRIPVNVELALLLLRTVTLLPRQYVHTILYERSASLKGVLSGALYPLLWIDRFNGRQTAEDMLLGVSRNSNTEHLRQFVEEFLDRHAQLVTHPFIEGDPDHDIGHIPPDVLIARDRLIADDPDFQYESSVQVVEPERGASSGRAKNALPSLPRRRPPAADRPRKNDPKQKKPRRR